MLCLYSWLVGRYLWPVDSIEYYGNNRQLVMALQHEFHDRETDAYDFAEVVAGEHDFTCFCMVVRA